MKILPAVIFFLVILFSCQTSFSQDSSAQIRSIPATQMQDTTIALEPSFKIKNVYARKDRYDAISDSIKASLVWSAKMHDTVILLNTNFVVENVYAEKDSLDALAEQITAKRNAFRDSLNAIGTALMRAADMQDTTIALDPSFVIREFYAKKDSLQVIRDSLRALLVQASQMQDTVIEFDPSFVVSDKYLNKDKADAMIDSVRAALADAAQMRDTVIALERSFVVRYAYAAVDRADAIRDSIARPTIMQDTVIALDPRYIVRDLYPLKDSLDMIKDSLHAVNIALTAIADSVNADSVRRHWAGWKKYEVQPSHSYTLNSQKLLKAKSKAALQYNIADFYLYLNGELVRSPKSEMGFFAAGCLAFISDDTLLLNSGLGFKVGVGVGIKIYQGKFTSLLHANTGNQQVFKYSEDDDVYKKSLTVEPVSQSLKLRSDPAYGGDVIIGEYQATYKKFYQKMDDGDNDEKKYNVRIIFRCRVSGGINNHPR
ncbi:MAG TPA: hypothetical protein VFI33_05860 [Puia sp.]|nr:hypothetical protein [Puia sp.]